MVHPAALAGRLVVVLLLLMACAPRHAAAQTPANRGPELRWGGDPEGGYPYVEADPNDPTRVVGFDVDVAALLAKSLGRQPRFVSVQYSSIDASVRRGDFDIGRSGIEETPARRAALSATLPYYEFTEILTVRQADAAKYRTLADFRGRRVGTLGGTIAYEILLHAESEHGFSACLLH